ncbi:hypothetical protein BLAT2472_20318 [Burkholderia latens]
MPAAAGADRRTRRRRAAVSVPVALRDARGRRVQPDGPGAAHARQRCAGAVPPQRGRPRTFPGRPGAGEHGAGAAGAAGAPVMQAIVRSRRARVYRRSALRIVCCGSRTKQRIARVLRANTRQLRFLTVIK